MKYIVVAYHTTDPMYSEHAVRLLTSMQAHALPYRVASLPPFKNWTEAIAYKPVFIETMLHQHPDKDILYVDADAAFKSWPTLFEDYPHDIGVFLRPDRELQSATIYVKNNPKGQFIVNRWVEEQYKRPKTWDQKTLQSVIDVYRDNISLGALPRSYCCKFDEPLKPEEGPLVIEQYQASRKVVKRL